MLYIFIMFCKSSVDMFFHSKLPAHERVRVTARCVRRLRHLEALAATRPRAILELDCAQALVAPVRQLPVASVACDAVRYICGR